MSKFVRVTKAPEKLEKGEYVIEAPNFVTEIKQCKRRAPKNNLTTANYMKDIAGAVGDKYMGEDFNALIRVNTSRFRGLPFETPEDVDEIVKRMFEKSAPEVFENYVDFYIKSRPMGTKLIYFLGDFNQTAAFTRNGIDEVKEKDVDVVLGKKKKKIVGKPAVKDEDVV